MWTLCFAGVVSIFFFFFSSPNLSSLRLDVYHSANLECRSEMYYTRLAGNTGPKNDAKNRHLRTIAQLCQAISWQLRHVSTIGKKLNTNIFCRCPLKMANYGPLMAEISWRVWGTPAISTGFASWLCYCTDVTHRRPTKLCTVFGYLLCWYTIYTFSGALAPSWNFATCKIHFVSKSCVLLYWQHYCMALQQQGQPNFVAE